MSGGSENILTTPQEVLYAMINVEIVVSCIHNTFARAIPHPDRPQSDFHGAGAGAGRMEWIGEIVTDVGDALASNVAGAGLNAVLLYLFLWV
jgi:hypothetical protein